MHPPPSGSGLLRAAHIPAGIALFAAPFQGSAGLRGAMLVVAGFMILAAHYRAGQFASLWPRERWLGIAVLAWLAAASAWSLQSPSFVSALSVVKRDILTSVLAFFVFHALTRTRRDMLRWLLVLVAGLMVLAPAIAMDPFDPFTNRGARLFVDVGWLSTWLVMVAPLLPLLLLQPPPGRRVGVAAFVVAVACLLVAGWYSGNRTVWLCFTAMLLVGVFEESRLPDFGKRVRRLAVTIALAIVALAMAAASVRYRAEMQPPAGTDAIAFAREDNRWQVWERALAMIAERPFAGHGFGNESLQGIFASGFPPSHRHLFIDAHNMVLDYMIQMGVTGAVVLLLLFAALVHAFARRRKAGGIARIAAVCGLALILGMFMRNMTADFFSRHAIQFFAAFLGMLMGLAAGRRGAGAGRQPGG